MSKKLLSVTVKGHTSKYSFHFYGDPKYIPEWEEEGILVEELLNVVPGWAAVMGLVTPYCFMQDLWNFKNPFAQRKGARVINVKNRW